MTYRIIVAISVAGLLGVGCFDVQDGSTGDILNSLSDEGEGDLPVITECQPISEEFDDAKSGQACTFPAGCGWKEDWWNPEGDPRHQISREMSCLKGSAVVTETFVLRHQPPLDDALWTDCTALMNGRTGESCDGEFTCLRAGPADCLEMVFCGPSTHLWRNELCDDRLQKINTDQDVISSCEEIADSVPNDPCEGEFLCAEGVPLEPCDDQVGYCVDRELGPAVVYHWCDGKVLHVLDDTFYHS